TKGQQVTIAIQLVAEINIKHGAVAIKPATGTKAQHVAIATKPSAKHVDDDFDMDGDHLDTLDLGSVEQFHDEISDLYRRCLSTVEDFFAVLYSACRTPAALACILACLAVFLASFCIASFSPAAWVETSATGRLFATYGPAHFLNAVLWSILFFAGLYAYATPVNERSLTHTPELGIVITVGTLLLFAVARQGLLVFLAIAAILFADWAWYSAVALTKPWVLAAYAAVVPAPAVKCRMARCPHYSYPNLAWAPISPTPIRRGQYAVYY
ncbi:hypothetical protein LTR53_017887, partial [Teratosphaeriaceae sp. CCFEE 6253]